MKHLIIIDAGGMGRTLFDIARESMGYGEIFDIKGYLDDNTHALDNYDNYPPVIGTIAGYDIQKDDVFTFSIGGDSRRKCIESLLERNAEFINLIHKTARIGTNVAIGVGNIIAAYTTLGADSCIGDYNLIQSYSVIGHDARIGSFNRIDTQVMCVGGIRIGDQVTIHTSAVINHNVTLGNESKVGACSFVLRNVKEGVTVFGIPAKKLI